MILCTKVLVNTYRKKLCISSLKKKCILVLVQKQTDIARVICMQCSFRFITKLIKPYKKLRLNGNYIAWWKIYNIYTCAKQNGEYRIIMNALYSFYWIFKSTFTNVRSHVHVILRFFFTTKRKWKKEIEQVKNKMRFEAKERYSADVNSFRLDFNLKFITFRGWIIVPSLSQRTRPLSKDLSNRAQLIFGRR